MSGLEEQGGGRCEQKTGLAPTYVQLLVTSTSCSVATCNNSLR